MALDVMRNCFYIDLSDCKKDFRHAFVIFRNPFHCRYKELIIFVTVYFLLHFVFLCVCNVNFKEIILMLN